MRREIMEISESSLCWSSLSVIVSSTPYPLFMSFLQIRKYSFPSHHFRFWYFSSVYLCIASFVIVLSSAKMQFYYQFSSWIVNENRWHHIMWNMTSITLPQATLYSFSSFIIWNCQSCPVLDQVKYFPFRNAINTGNSERYHWHSITSKPQYISGSCILI